MNSTSRYIIAVFFFIATEKERANLPKPKASREKRKLKLLPRMTSPLLFGLSIVIDWSHWSWWLPLPGWFSVSIVRRNDLVGADSLFFILGLSAARHPRLYRLLFTFPTFIRLGRGPLCFLQGPAVWSDAIQVSDHVKVARSGSCSSETRFSCLC